MKVQRAVVVALTSVFTRASHLKVLCQIFFYVMDKALLDELTSTGKVLFFFLF